jgi:hypothetical protein
LATPTPTSLPVEVRVTQALLHHHRRTRTS